MARYLIIESRDPFDSSDSAYFSELVQGIAGRGNETKVFFVQNGVLPLRKGAKHNELITSLVQNKIEVLADGFSLRERAINRVVDGVRVADFDRIVDLLLEPGTKSIWH